jgi:hypothetical protein
MTGWVKIALFAAVFYIIGAKFPMLAQKVGIA